MRREAPASSPDETIPRKIDGVPTLMALIGTARREAASTRVRSRRTEDSLVEWI